MDSAPGLPGLYDKSFQRELLRHCLRSDELMSAAHPLLRADDFGINVCGVVWEAMAHFYSSSGTTPKSNSVLGLVVLKVLDNKEGLFTSSVEDEEYQALAELMENIDRDDPLNPEWMIAELPGFVADVRSRKVLAEASYGFGPGARPQVVADRLNQVLDDTETARRNPFSSPTKAPMLLSADDLMSVRITTGLSQLDAFLDGGLERGDLGMVVATPGVGKTTMLLHFGTMAAYAGYRVLFITLELSAKKIHQRYLAMSSGVELDYFKRPQNMWPEECATRLAVAVDPNYPIHDKLIVSDESMGGVTTMLIEQRIKAWKKMCEAQYGTDADCALVCVDWLKLIESPAGSAEKDEWQKIVKNGTQLKKIGIRQGVAIWTAQQGNKQADGKKFVHMSNTAYAYNANDPMDVALGVGRCNGEEDDDNPLAPPRKHDFLTCSVNKNRHGGCGACKIYRSPTMRVFDSEEEYECYQRASRAKSQNLAAMFAINSDKARTRVSDNLDLPKDFNYAPSRVA
jgi:hypothetical protein